MKTSTRRCLLPLLLSAGLMLAGVAHAIQPGTNGTEKRYQQSGVRMGVPVMRNLTATASAGAATLNAAGAGVITSESLTTAAGATYTLTLTNSMIAAGDIVLVTVGNGTNAAGSPALTTVTPGAGSVVIVVQNIAAAAALNGTLKIGFVVVKQTALDAD